jgi:hypothetical protein
MSLWEDALDYVFSEAALQRMCGDRLPIQAAITRHLAAVHPFCLEGALRDPRTGKKVPGIPRGYCGDNRSGGVFPFDVFLLYAAGLIQNSNIMVFGEPNSHKSGDAKCDVFRGAAVGYNFSVTDVTGEWTPVANAIPGSKVLKFGQIQEGEERYYINPLDPTISHQDQHKLLAGMAVNAIGTRHGSELRQLEIEERTLLWWAVVDAHQHFGVGGDGLPLGVPTLPVLVEKLRDPTEFMAKGMQETQANLRQVGRHMFLGLNRLVKEDLKGIADQETTVGLWQDTPLLVMNCEGMDTEAAVQLVLLIEYFQRSQWNRDNPRFRIHHKVHDEVWNLSRVPAFVESVRDDFKQSGKRGISVTLITHHLQNLHRSGSTRAVEELVEDSDIKICYRMKPAPLRESAADLKLNIAEQDIVLGLKSNETTSESLYKIGDRPGIKVYREAWPEELPLVQTRGLMHGRERMTDLERAEPGQQDALYRALDN